MLWGSAMERQRSTNEYITSALRMSAERFPGISLVIIYASGALREYLRSGQLQSHDEYANIKTHVGYGWISTVCPLSNASRTA